MNLFVIGVGEELEAEVAAAALRSLLRDVPFLADARAGEHLASGGGCAGFWVQHAPEQIGGVCHAASDERGLALWAGRPVRFTDEAEADGRSPLVPESYLAPAAGWVSGLDGRATVARLDFEEQVLEVWTDPLGAYPVFRARAAGGTWVSNNPELLRRLGADGRRDPAVVASLVGGGWSLSGDPLHPGTRRLAPGSIHRFTATGEQSREELRSPSEVAALPGGGLDPERAAAILVANVRALADWPGRPSVVPVTGGRDSRLVLAAALAAGIEFEATTGGPSEHPDVVGGRLLCEAVGIPHVPLAADPHGDMWGDPRRAVELVDLTSAGTACAADGAGFPHGPRAGPLVLWHSGQGGEVGRAYYGLPRERDAGGLTDFLYRAFVARRPGRVELLAPAGQRLVREEIGAFVEAKLTAGVRAEDVPDLFYLERRMATWAAPTHACVEWVKDTTSPLWTARLLPDLLGPSAVERQRAEFHRRVLEVLAPELVAVPFSGGAGWSERRSPLARRAARAAELARKAGAESRRRAISRVRRSRGSTPAEVPGGDPRAGALADPFAAVLAGVAAALPAPDDELWRIVERERVERLLGRDASSLDTMSRYYVWRLAQVLWPRRGTQDFAAPRETGRGAP